MPTVIVSMELFFYDALFPMVIVFHDAFSLDIVARKIKRAI